LSDGFFVLPLPIAALYASGLSVSDVLAARVISGRQLWTVTFNNPGEDGRRLSLLCSPYR
jgi:hypothetical protein